MSVLPTGDARLDTIFAALSDPTRRAILERLANREATVGELAAPFAMSLPAISKHLRVLENAGLLARRREGRVHHCRLTPEPIEEAAGWLERYRRFWETRLDALDELLRTGDRQETSGWRPRVPTRPSSSAADSKRRASGSSARSRTRKP